VVVREGLEPSTSAYEVDTSVFSITYRIASVATSTTKHNEAVLSHVKFTPALGSLEAVISGV
jgi:hypothetical protein